MNVRNADFLKMLFQVLTNAWVPTMETEWRMERKAEKQEEVDSTKLDTCLLLSSLGAHTLLSFLSYKLMSFAHVMLCHENLLKHLFWKFFLPI